jgi:NhaP-type Na+/H+ or K+/H+ antiporter
VLQELAVIALLSYFSYLLADVTGLSGILALFVCGVVVSHYALHNVSEEGQRATLTGFRWDGLTGDMLLLCGLCVG